MAAVLPAGALFAVGGRVRDELRHPGASVPNDLDYVVTGVALDDLRARLEAIGRVDLVGASFAVIKLTTQGQTVDVAMPRRERSIGTGHRDFAVETGPEVSLEDDLARRDFRRRPASPAASGSVCGALRLSAGCGDDRGHDGGGAAGNDGLRGACLR